MATAATARKEFAHPAQLALQQHQKRRAEIVDRRRFDAPARNSVRRQIRAGNRVIGPIGLAEHVAANLRAGRAPAAFAAWCSIVIAQSLARGYRAVQLAHADFVEALERAGTRCGSRTVQTCAARAEAIGLVLVDRDFDDLRSSPRRARCGVKLLKWRQRPNIYRPGPLLVELWESYQRERRAAVDAHRGAIPRRPPRAGSKGSRTLRSKRSIPHDSDLSKSAVDRVVGAGRSVPPSGGGHGCSSTLDAPPQLQLDAPPANQLLRGQASDGGDGSETPRQREPEATSGVFESAIVRDCRRKLRALVGL